MLMRSVVLFHPPCRVSAYYLQIRAASEATVKPQAFSGEAAISSGDLEQFMKVVSKSVHRYLLNNHYLIIYIVFPSMFLSKSSLSQ